LGFTIYGSDRSPITPGSRSPDKHLDPYPRSQLMLGAGALFRLAPVQKSVPGWRADE